MISKFLCKGAFAIVLSIVAVGCGSKSNASAQNSSTTSDSAANSQADGGGSGSDAGPGGDASTITGGGTIGSTVAVTASELQIVTHALDADNNLQQAALKGQVLVPAACSAATPCGLIVVVGDYRQPPWPTMNNGAKQLASDTNSVVVIFNLPGTGDGGNKSEGSDDMGGLWHISAVKDVMHQLSARKDVDKTKTGFVSIGTGLMAVAASLKTFGNGDLGNVAWLIDVEGPVDRCGISQAPEDDGQQIGPSDGAGASDSACHYTLYPHADQYPAASNGHPASIVCAPGAWPITVTGAGCDKNDWWISREPYTNLKGITQKYWRLQFANDHALPSHVSSMLAIKAVASSPAHAYAVNWLLCKVPSETECKDLSTQNQACWLGDSTKGNGFAPAPFASGPLKAMTADVLLGLWLPKFVNTINDPSQFSNCK